MTRLGARKQWPGMAPTPMPAATPALRPWWRRGNPGGPGPRRRATRCMKGGGNGPKGKLLCAGPCVTRWTSSTRRLGTATAPPAARRILPLTLPQPASCANTSVGRQARRGFLPLSPRQASCAASVQFVERTCWQSARPSHTSFCGCRRWTTTRARNRPCISGPRTRYLGSRTATTCLVTRSGNQAAEEHEHYANVLVWGIANGCKQQRCRP